MWLERTGLTWVLSHTACEILVDFDDRLMGLAASSVVRPLACPIGVPACPNPWGGWISGIMARARVVGVEG